MQKEVTLQTEVARGVDAISNINDDEISDVNHDYTAFDFINNVAAIVSLNKQRNTDTDGFYLGAYFEAWVVMNTYVTDMQYSNWPDDEKYQWNIANKQTITYYNLFRAIQAQYGIDDKTLCKIAARNYDVINPYFDKYWILTHSDK